MDFKFSGSHSNPSLVLFLCRRFVTFYRVVRARILPILGLVFFQPPMFAAHICQRFNQVCVAFNLFLFFAFSLSCSTMFWFDKANRLSAFFFHFGVRIWRFPGVSIATSVLHSITWVALYSLFMHSPLASQKQDILLSI